MAHLITAARGVVRALTSAGARGRWRWPPAVADLVLAILLFAMEYAYLGDVWVSAALVAALPLRSRFPLGAWRLALVVTAVLGFGFRELLPGGGVGGVVFLLCAYSAAVRGDRELTIGIGVVSVIAAAALPPNWLPAVTAAVATAAVVALADVVRTRGQLLARYRDERARGAVLEERARIARELHDVVAHHVSVIAIQAEAAPYRVPEVPLERSLTEIRATALDALGEMRRLLGVLRDGAGTDHAPQPGLDRLGELLAGARRAGLEVRERVSGPPVALPPGVDLSAYRIVQEALSNAMRHAPGSTVQVDIAYRPGEMRVAVANGAPPVRPGDTDADRPRHGLVGMHERVAMLGGRLVAQPSPGGGFVIDATLPL